MRFNDCVWLAQALRIAWDHAYLASTQGEWVFFRKRIGLPHFVAMAWVELRRRRADRLWSVGIIDSQYIEDLDKLEISNAVDDVIADVGLLTGLQHRLVDSGPRLPLEATLQQITIGLMGSYSSIGLTDTDADNRIKSVLAVVQATYAPEIGTASDLWTRAFAVVLPKYLGSEPHFAFFAALVTEQNKLLVPLQETLLKRYRPVLA